MFEEFIIIACVSLAVIFSVRTFIKQFIPTGDTSCPTCGGCSIPEKDSKNNSYSKIKYKRVNL